MAFLEREKVREFARKTSSAFWSLCNGLCPLAPIQCSVHTPVFLNSYSTEEYSLGWELTLKPKHTALLVELIRKLLNYNFLVNTNSALSHTLQQLRNLTHSDTQGHMSTKSCPAAFSFGQIYFSLQFINWFASKSSKRWAKIPSE